MKGPTTKSPFREWWPSLIGILLILAISVAYWFLEPEFQPTGWEPSLVND